MGVQEQYYVALKAGTKTIELRLWDKKRQAIKIGDTVCFSNDSNPADTFEAHVVALHKASTFKNLFNTIDIHLTGMASTNEALTALEEYYPIEKQEEFSVVGIEVKL